MLYFSDKWGCSWKKIFCFSSWAAAWRNQNCDHQLKISSPHTSVHDDPSVLGYYTMSTGNQLLNLRGTLCLHLQCQAKNPKWQKSSKDGNSSKMVVAAYQLTFYDIPQDSVL